MAGYPGAYSGFQQVAVWLEVCIPGREELAGGPAHPRLGCECQSGVGKWERQRQYT